MWRGRGGGRDGHIQLFSILLVFFISSANIFTRQFILKIVAQLSIYFVSFSNVQSFDEIVVFSEIVRLVQRALLR